MARAILIIGLLTAFLVVSLAWPARQDDLPESSSVVAARDREKRFEPEVAAFALRYGSITSPYRTQSAFLVPGDTLRLEAIYSGYRRVTSIDAPEGTLMRRGPGKWAWIAPSTPGMRIVSIRDEQSDDRIVLHAWVLTPFSHRAESINGYKIGRYQAHPLRNDPAYLRPKGFIEVTPENENTLVSPHFRLRQFVAKQESGYPKYLILSEKLLLKLERILAEVNRMGHEATTLHVMSGYRTPWYNRNIGNETGYSRHLYGDAADIFVDVDGDENMDDLNGDGAIDTGDARFLMQAVEKMNEDPAFRALEGGMGAYPATDEHGPFIHVDTRGKKSRW